MHTVKNAREIRIYVLWILSVFAILVFPQVREAQAAQIKRVHSSAVSVSEFDNRITAPLLDAIDPSKSVTFLSAEVEDLSNPSEKESPDYGIGEGAGLFSYYFEDNSTLAILRDRVRDVPSVRSNIQYQVVEFLEGVRVYRGVTLFSDDVFIKNISLPDVNTSAAFPILNVRSQDWTDYQGETALFKATFTNAQTLKIERLDVPVSLARMAPPRVEVEWQVIEFLSGVSVKSGVQKFSHYAEQVTVDLSPDPIKQIDKAFLVFNYAAGAGTNGREGLTLVRGMIEDDKTLSFHRAQKGSKMNHGIDLAWYLIELTDESSWVQKGTEHFTDTEYSKQITLRPIDPERSLVITSVSGGLSLDSPQASSSLHSFKIRPEITGKDRLTLSRMNDPDVTEQEADVNWFVIEFGPLTVKSPNGGEVLRMGERFDITWQHAASLEKGGNAPGDGRTAAILLSRIGGKRRELKPFLLASGIPIKNDQYAWVVPEFFNERSLISDKWRIKVVVSDLTERHSDTSDNNFAIKGKLNVISPQGGEIWYVGSSDQLIKWRYKGEIGKVAIYYDTDSGINIDAFPEAKLVASDIPCGISGEGSYQWISIPDVTTRRAKIKVVQQSDPNVYSVSKNDFSIWPRITITNPAIGIETWLAQTKQTISWESSGVVENYNVLYSANGGKNWVYISESFPAQDQNKNIFQWDIPRESVGNQILIKVENAKELGSFDIVPRSSGQSIAILPWIRVTSPNIENERLTAGGTYPVTWELNGPVDFVSIEYSTDGGQNWQKEAVVKARDRMYQWKVPNIQSNQVKIRLTDMNDISHSDVSDYPGLIE